MSKMMKKSVDVVTKLVLLANIESDNFMPLLLSVSVLLLLLPNIIRLPGKLSHFKNICR